MNVIMNVGQATIQGAVTIENQTGNFDVSVSNVTIWMQVKIDPTMNTATQVQQLQISIDDFSGSGTILTILEALFPFIAALVQLGATPYPVAGAINNQLNSKIIDGINGTLSGLKTASTLSQV